eukprot:TRINITY_DN8836_c0_g1_i2.p1 TRINITY_DN8836_c0_g1~~TRINITY_DN8836_c0_g1_i2.p1  ORF type:complete len:313 (+),score=60.51 TRINITY_DN8836_c0_g1_i2:304-1242(+)
MSESKTVNPDFYNWNHVLFVYCDGASFGGYRKDPVTFQGTPLYFRGLRNLLGIVNDLTTNYGFGYATDVFLTGNSAGALAVYLHADFFQTLLPSSVLRYKAMPISGFFLDHNTVEDKPVYPEQMQYVWQMHNVTGHTECTDSKESQERWQCIFAFENYPLVRVPLFVLNSAVDSWQTRCILTSEPIPGGHQNCSAVPGWQDCSQYLDTCAPQQISVYDDYHTTFLATLMESSGFTTKGNGAFISSCLTHGISSTAWEQLTIDGVLLRDAVWKWWIADGATAADHTHLPCTLATTEPYQCNPTCDDATPSALN